MKKEKKKKSKSADFIHEIFNAFDYYEAESFCFSQEEIVFYDREGKIIQKLKVNKNGTLEIFQSRQREKTYRS